jgi:hypothetical protein
MEEPNVLLPMYTSCHNLLSNILAQIDYPGAGLCKPNTFTEMNSQHCMKALFLDSPVRVVFVQDAPELLGHYSKKNKTSS